VIPGIVASAQMIGHGAAAAAVAFADTGCTFPWYGLANYPTALHDSGTTTTWITWEAWDGATRFVYVTHYNHATGYWGPIQGAGVSPLTDDDHGTPALCLDHEGYLHMFHGSHGSAQRHSVTRVPIDESPGDASPWLIQPEITGTYSYPHPSLVGSSLYLFLRETDTLPSSRYLVLYKTSALADGVATWGSELTIVDFGASSRFYNSVNLVVGTDIHIVATMADGADTERTGVYYFVYDTTDGSVRNFDSTETVASGSLPIDLTLANSDFRLIDHGANRGDIPAFCLDTNGDPHIVYADGTGTGDYDLMHIMWTGAAWSSPVTAATVQCGTGVGIGGTVETIALVARPGGAVELWYPLDPGSAWDRGGNMTRRVRSSGGTWGPEIAVADAGSYALGQPSAVRDGHADARVIFCEHTQVSSTEAGDLELYLWGDGGFIAYEAEPAAVITTAADGKELREDSDDELREDSTFELREVPV
jgi:hypothetical protein